MSAFSFWKLVAPFFDKKTWAEVFYNLSIFIWLFMTDNLNFSQTVSKLLDVVVQVSEHFWNIYRAQSSNFFMKLRIVSQNIPSQKLIVTKLQRSNAQKRF